MEVHSGNTHDISKFHFHIWEPVWYCKPCKVPENPWRKARWLGFSEGAGDEMYYFIKTEGGKKPQYLTKPAICSQRKNIGTDKEYVSKEPKYQPELKKLEL
eukprot:9063738-Ditylum_brightwellii.AAC.1